MPDSRGNIVVDLPKMREWTETHFNVYARDVVKIDGDQLPLALSCSMNKQIIVSLGKDMLYNGRNMVEAVRIFNLSVEKLYDIWINLNKKSKGKVIHQSS